MRKIGALIFPGFEMLDLYGPLEMFGLMPDAFQIDLIAEISGPVPASNGPSSLATASFSDRFDYDILLVPGGRGTRKEVDNPVLIDWITQAGAQAEFTLSVCTGSILLAQAGMLDGKQATTNKMGYANLTPRWPKVDWKATARWVEDGNIVTSSGVSAGMDMALGFIEHLHGLDAAEQVARYAEYSWHRDKSHDPFASEFGLT